MYTPCLFYYFLYSYMDREYAINIYNNNNKVYISITKTVQLYIVSYIVKQYPHWLSVNAFWTSKQASNDTIHVSTNENVNTMFITMYNITK